MPVEKVLDFEAALLAYMNAEHGEWMRGINTTGAYDDSIEGTMRQAIDSFKATQTW